MTVKSRAQVEVREDGFTMIELVVALSIFFIVIAPMAAVFYSSIRTAGVASHRTDGAAIASREIEALRAVPYTQVGFYADQPGYVNKFESLDTVTLGATSPATGNLVPQMQPETPDPNAATGYAPDPNPANANSVVLGNVKFTISRYIVWATAQDPATTYTQAYKRLTVIVTWSDQASALHQVRQDSLLYPGGQGPYSGAAGGPTTTTTTTAPQPPVISLVSVTTPPDPAGQTQLALIWSQTSGGTVTSYTIKYSTDPAMPAGNFTTIAEPPSVTSFTVTGLTANTTYWFVVIANVESSPQTSNELSGKTNSAGATCTLGGLNVAGATTLSTTGTILANGNKMSEDLTLSWSTTGTCTDGYNVHATDPTNSTDPGSPYTLTGSAGAYSGSVPSSGQHGWAIGLHTFTVWDTTTNKATTVVKTFKVCTHGASSC